MTLQSLNHFGRILAAVAVAVTIFAVSSRAKDKQWDDSWVDGCKYVTIYNRAIPVGQPGYALQYRIGCLVKDGSGQDFYRDDVNNVWTNLTTDRHYQMSAAGWMDVPQPPSSIDQVVRQVLGPDAVEETKPAASGCDLACVNRIGDEARTNVIRTILAPPCNHSYNGCR